MTSRDSYPFGGTDPLGMLVQFVRAVDPDQVQTFLRDAYKSHTAAQPKEKADRPTGGGSAQPQSSAKPELPRFLEAAQAMWSEGCTQATMTAQEKEYLRGQAELIVELLGSTGELTTTPLMPEREDLLLAVSNAIVRP